MGAEVLRRLSAPVLMVYATGVGEERKTPGMAEAADMLGITTGAVRNRLSRGTFAQY